MFFELSQKYIYFVTIYMITLKNHQNLVKIASKGAQLITWKNSESDKEILWQQNDKYWNRVAPILFPIVGRLKGDRFRYKDDYYPMSQHGFAREAEFDVIASAEDSATFSLKSNVETRGVYPFDFELIVNYSLSGSILKVNHTVINTGLEIMPFSIGAHPGFHLEGDISEYKIEIPGATSKKRFLLDAGIFSGKTEGVDFEQGGFLPLSEKYFELDAIVFKNENIHLVRLWRNNMPQLELEITGVEAPYWGFWKKPNAPFFCIEPWWGLADSAEFDADLSVKEGINSVMPNEKRSFDYQIKLL